MCSMSSGRGALLQHLMIKCTHQWVVTNSNATAAELAICSAFKKKNTNNPKEQKMSPGGFKSEKIYSLTVCVCVRAHVRVCVCVALFISQRQSSKKRIQIPFLCVHCKQVSIQIQRHKVHFFCRNCEDRLDQIATR